MAHLVRHCTAAGEVVTEEVADLDAAVARVEQLRNDGTADDVRVFAEVPLRVETIVKVSVAPLAASPQAPSVEESPADPAPLLPTSPEFSAETHLPPPVAVPVDPPPGAMLAPATVAAPSADAEDLVDADAVVRRGLFHRA